VTLVVEAEDADALGDEPVRADGRTVGWVTSGGFAHWVGRSVAMGYVPAELAVDDAAFEVDILGVPRPARLVALPLFDPAGERMRS